MAAPCPLLGDGITDDMLLHIASFLPIARDLVCLGLTNTRFAAKIIAAPRVGQLEGGAAAAPEMLSFVEEAARLWAAGCSEQERGWVPRRDVESWLGLMNEVGLLRVPLVFGRAHADFTLFENGVVATNSAVGGRWRTAANKVVMRSGRHFAHFTLVAGNIMTFGVIRPGWNVEGDEDADEVDGHCFYWTLNGGRYPGDIEWEGRQPAREQGDHIGMLLDLDQGSMTVWKNDVRLGVMVAEGLSGPFCWAVRLSNGGPDSARIESAPAPASPTEEELAAAKVWQEANLVPDNASDDEW